jgi:cytochrome c-type biogenesis protein CcmF
VRDPVADFGQLVLFLALIGAVYAGVVAVAGARRGSARMVLSAERAVYAVAALATVASAVMVYAFVSHDFAIKFVQGTSDSTMPLFYKITSYWGGLDGSILFWVFLLSVFGAIAVWVNRDRHRNLLPYVIATLMAVLTFFLVTILFAKDPFDTFLSSAPRDGKGLSPLLQNFYMVFHPPSLYTGLVGMTVPFAFGLAALVTGDLDDAWLYSVRRWVLVAWFFLSLGLVLGMLWAYEVLGWGGYWGWDPVENAGFLGWLTATAFLHSIMIQERRGMLKVWNMSLVIVTFTLTIVATFLTRSGIVQSVHAFGYDPQLKVLFLCFIGLILVVSFGFLIYRLPQLRSRAELDSLVSREFAFVLNNWLLLVSALVILFLTLLPTLSEAINGTRMTVGMPTYNKVMAPIGLALLLLMGIGPLIAWRKATVANLRQQFTIPILTGVVVSAAIAIFIPGSRVGAATFFDRLHLPLPIFCYGLCAFTLATIVQEFVRGVAVRRKQTGGDPFTSMVGLVLRGQRRYGGYIIHLGIVLMFVGWAGNSYQTTVDASLQKGQSVALPSDMAGRLTVRFDYIDEHDTLARQDTVAHFTILQGDNEVRQMAPARWIFTGHEDEPVTHVDIWRRPQGDVYLTPKFIDGDNQVAAMRIIFNPLVDWVWVGFMMLMFGTAVALAPERLLEVAGVRIPAGAVAAAAALLIITSASVVRAQGSPSAQPPPEHVISNEVWTVPPTPEEQELFQQIVCLCGCGRQTIGDCNCQQAARLRDEVRSMLQSGKTPDEVIDYYQAKYGDEILASPRTKLAWIIPGAAVGLGAALVVFVAIRWMRRSRQNQTPTSALTMATATAGASGTTSSSTPDTDLDDRLDEELRSLD